MNLHRAALGPIALSQGEPPSEFRIFAMGWNETSKGRFLFDDEAADAVLRDYREQGNELCVDYDHRAVDPNARAGDGKAAGWFRLKVREDGLWAIDVRWTPPAEKALRNREYRYFSPAFFADRKTKRIVQLINLALTNIPATKRMTPLVAARAATKERAIMGNKELQESAESPPAESEEELEDDEDEDDEDGEEAAAESTEGDDEEEMAEDDDESEDEEEEEEDEEEDESPESKRKASRLSIVRVARELTGKTRPSEIVGVLRAHKHAREQVVALSARVQKLEKTLIDQKVRQLVARAVRAGKITPALRKWAVSLGRQDIAQLRAYLDQAAPIVPVGRPEQPAAAGSVITLSADELRICEQVQITPEEYARRKAAN